MEIETIPREQIPAAIAALAARLLMEPSGAPARESADVWLSVDQAAAKIGRSPRWFYRNAKRLPFVKRLSRKVLLVSEQGMVAWIATRKA